MITSNMLLLRNVTQNISDNVFEFTINKKKEAMHFIDVSGLKYHRKRWIPYFQDVLSIIFIVAISSYDQMMSEDKETNRMVDAIGLFKHIINHPLLAKPDMILFFNKKDIYEVKVKKISIKNHFPDYTGMKSY
ncbi:hypothetical protein HDV02_005545 [Globomyces sp. JEL0801]|nr:hypothetical protein HDV02_005545 [Globomyces sp. JEL0801]